MVLIHNKQYAVVFNLWLDKTREFDSQDFYLESKFIISLSQLPTWDSTLPLEDAHKNQCSKSLKNSEPRGHSQGGLLSSTGQLCPFCCWAVLLPACQPVHCDIFGEEPCRRAPYCAALAGNEHLGQEVSQGRSAMETPKWGMGRRRAKETCAVWPLSRETQLWRQLQRQT